MSRTWNGPEFEHTLGRQQKLDTLFNYEVTYWTRDGTNIHLERPSRQGDSRTADRFIPMGVWRDSFAATIRKTGAVTQAARG
jgi:hypothetical protein